MAMAFWGTIRSGHRQCDHHRSRIEVDQLRQPHRGYSGSGTLTVSDGGQVTAKSLSINSQSTVRLHVSGDRMLVLGNARPLAASAIVASSRSWPMRSCRPATYRPIGEYADRNLDWSGSGSTLAVGGTWDASTKTFTVIDPTSVEAGAAAEVAGGQRLLITDPAQWRSRGRELRDADLGHHADGRCRQRRVNGRP